MSVSVGEREELHLALDYLLNARAGLERIDPKQLSPGRQWHSAWSGPRRELVRDGSKFLRRVFGEKLHASELSILLDTPLKENAEGSDVMATLANTIRSFWPLFAPLQEGEEQSQFVANIVDDLMGVYWGDEPRFFQIGKRTQGSPKRPFRVAYLRKSALDWEKRLAVVGFKSFQRQSIVSQAYKTSWEAIRKWSQSIVSQFDLVSHPPQFPELVKDAYEDDSETFLQMIRDDGEAYWAEVTGTKLEKIRKSIPEFYW